jgi:transposase-like protein
MGQVHHGSTTTTHAVRAAIQRSQASLATLSRELGIDPKTVAKWRKRATVEDLKTGPKAPHSTTLTEAKEAMVVAFRRHTLLPLDDCLYALQLSIPHLTRSTLLRCLQRHGISRLPDIEGDKLRTRLADFMAAYNFARWLKTLSGLTPYEYIAKIWTSEPDRFIVNPIRQMPGLNTYTTTTSATALHPAWRDDRAERNRSGGDAVVARDVPPGCIVGGVPARMICQSSDYYQTLKKSNKGVPVVRFNRAEKRRSRVRN